MARIRAWWILALLLAATAPAVQAAPAAIQGGAQPPDATQKVQSPEQWLKDMLESSRSSSFSGHSVMMSGGQVVSMAIYHAPINGEVWERVVQLSGEPAEIIRQGNDVYCLHPRQSMGLAVNLPINRLTALEESLQSVSRYYQFERGGADRVAGRQVIRFNLSPNDTNRYGYRLWLDSASGVLLKSETLPHAGKPLEVFEFIDVNMGAQLAQSDFEPGPGLTRTSLDAADKNLQQPARDWQPEWLPEGFVEAQRVARFQGQGKVTARAYTDGLASFTVFHEPRDESITESASTRGATVAVHRNLPGAMVTVVGEIPLATAQRIAASVKSLAEAP